MPRSKVQFMPVVVVADASQVTGVDTRPRVRPATSGGSGSHLVGGLAAADGYAIVAAEVDEVRAGDPVTVMLVT